MKKRFISRKGDNMEINFTMIDRDNPIISINGYVDFYDGSDYCMTFYDSFDDLCFRVPINPFAYYTDNYYDYVDLVYSFECDEQFMSIVKEFAESANSNITIQRPHYDLVLKKI